MGIVSWIILGLIAGTIAKALMPGRDPGGLVGTTIIGIIGSFIGGWLSYHFMNRPVQHTFFDGRSWISAIVGSLVLLAVYRIIFGNSRSRRRPAPSARSGPPAPRRAGGPAAYRPAPPGRPRGEISRHSPRLTPSPAMAPAVARGDG